MINSSIAKQGATLAKVTSSDSAAMRYIAVVTVWFLPATFLAVRSQNWVP
jgi:hypothetical protein